MKLNSKNYEGLHKIAISRIAEYYAKYVLTLNGLDVYTTEVDNKGIDFVVRTNKGSYYDIQVKSIRYPKTSYCFINKDHEWSQLRKNLFLILVVFRSEKEPEIYLIPSTVFETSSEIFKNKSENKHPEWGINYSEKNITVFEKYKLEKQVKLLS